jgi:hypothetical protein
MVATVVLAALMVLGPAAVAWAQTTPPASGTAISTAAPGEPGQPATQAPPPPTFKQAMENTWAKIENYVPNILIALAVLGVGTILAWIIAGIVHWVLDKLALDKRLKHYLPKSAAAEEGKPYDSSRWISTAVFWILELFVIAGFFQVLKFPSAEESLKGLLTRIFEYLPRLLGATLILLVAWIVAGVLRFIVTRALLASKLDERLRKRVGAGQAEASKWSLSEALGKTVYWLVFVLFLPAVFDALSIEGLRNPMSAMLDKVLTYLPNLFLAAVILVVGWLVAQLVQRILGNLLAALGTNQLAERVGLSKVLGKKTLSDLIALVVYVLILVPVVIAALNALSVTEITRPASDMLNSFLAAIPKLFGAALILVVAWVVGRLLCRLTANLLEGVGFDRLPAKLGLGSVKGEGEGGEKKTSLSQVCGYIVLVAVMLFASLQALDLLEFKTLATLVSEFLVYVGKVSLALVILGLGLYLAALAARTIQASNITYAVTLSVLARVAIIGVAAAMALERIGVGESIVQTVFTLVLGAMAVAVAIAFGVGGRDLAKQHLEEWSQKLKEKKAGQGRG